MLLDNLNKRLLTFVLATIMRLDNLQMVTSSATVRPKTGESSDTQTFYRFSTHLCISAGS